MKFIIKLIPSDPLRAKQFARWGAGAGFVWGLLYAALGLGLLVPFLVEKTLEFGWRVMANPGFYFTPVEYRPAPSFCFLYAYLYLTLAYAIHTWLSVIAAVGFLLLEVWFTYYALFLQRDSFNVIPAILLVAAISGLRGTIGYQRSLKH